MIYRAVCLGGTFNVLHAGHRALLDAAFSLGKHVYIGITADRFASSSRTRVRPYRYRAAAVRKYCSRFAKSCEISPLSDPYGPAAYAPHLQAIVVTEDNAFRSDEINKIRRKNGVPPLQVYVLTLLRTFDGRTLSSSRILSGECNPKGVLLRHLKVGVGTKSPPKMEGVREAFALLGKRNFKGVTLHTVRVSSGVSEQPFGEQTLQGAVRRAENAIEGNDLGVGIEAGLIRQPDGGFLDVQYCAIIDAAGRTTVGHGIGFAYPKDVIERALGGETVGEIISELSGVKSIGRKEGAVGYLSRGILSRAAITRDAVIAALIPRIRPDLYFGEGTLKRTEAVV
ncbi:MAG: inosine/xanthosine triphosphatase [Methanomassiliicoccales archaeon]